VRSEATTVEDYLAELPQERRHALEVVRGVILEHLPEGYQETMSWGMIAYEVPLGAYPDTYNKQPLMLAALASQKNHMAVYLSAIYSDDEVREHFEAAYRETGKWLDVGKSCVRFRRLDDLPLEVIGAAIQAVPMDRFIETYERGRTAARNRAKKS